MPTGTDGGVLFARYVFPPNELGYCGPADSRALLRHAASAGSVAVTVPAMPSDEVERRARKFEGAWVYLELIAAAAGIADPMDPRVVEGYWVGNDLVDALDPAALTAELSRRFAAQLVGPAARRWERMRPGDATAHHGFHVLAVYPWFALLPARSGAALAVLQSCRIRWGTVARVEEDRLAVRSRPLTWDGTRLALGDEREESVRWREDGLTPAGAPEPGQVVACHWDWVCDSLTPEQAEQLAERTAHQLETLGIA
jgi:hypothetical protein